MAQSLQLNIHYPFGNPNKQPAEDADSYHSLTLDDKKLNYFDQQTDQSLSRMPQANIKKKNPLPPSYPYEEVKRLKQSLSLRNKSKVIPDNQSINSTDSFHTANEFQSICYEEGDFQKIMQQMQHPQHLQPESIPNFNQQNDTSNKENHPSLTSSKFDKYQQKLTNQQIQSASFQSHQAHVPMQQSDALNDFDIEDLQNLQSDGQKYEAFEVRQLNQQNSKNLSQRHQEIEEEKEVEISQIQNALNQSELIDHEILELTRQLQIIHSSQQNLIHQNHFSQQFSLKQQILAQRYSIIESRLKQLQSVQKNFTCQLSNMHQLMKKTQKNNSYLQKELEFFRQKSKEFQEKEKIIEEKQQLLKNKQLNTSKTHSLSLIEQKAKPKTYHIKPKTPNNQSAQSRKYKELTFEYCLASDKLETEDKWSDLEIDSQNNPPEYKLVYSFQHQNTILAVRLIDLITNENSRSSWNSKKPLGQGSTIRKNYQYLIDFADKKYQSQEDKIKCLSKQLVVNLGEQKYVCKQFTRKIEVYVMICEEETFIDLVKLVPLPNPLAFYIENRFNFLGQDSKSSQGFEEGHGENAQNQNQEKNKKQANLLKTSDWQKSLSNLARFMKSYVIKIEQMADVQSIQKLMSLKWVNSDQSQEMKYFTIKGEGSDKVGKQLFFVKIEDCVLQSGPEYESLKGRHRYSLTFRVGSTFDNDLLVDLIEFLTFLTVY